MFEQAFRNIDDALRKEAGCTTELIFRIVVGTVVPHVNLGETTVYRAPSSLLKKQRQIAKPFDEIFARNQQFESLYHLKFVVLDILKKSLLHQTFIGQQTQLPANWLAIVWNLAECDTYE
jgi:hypothetical protein